MLALLITIILLQICTWADVRINHSNIEILYKHIQEIKKEGED